MKPPIPVAVRQAGLDVRKEITGLEFLVPMNSLVFGGAMPLLV